MSNRLVDREKQLRRIDDDVVAARGDGFGLQLLDDFVPGFFRIAQPRIVLDVLVVVLVATMMLLVSPILLLIWAVRWLDGLR